MTARPDFKVGNAHVDEVRMAVWGVLAAKYGSDNVSGFLDDVPGVLGVCFEDGAFVTVEVCGDPSPPRVSGSGGNTP